MPPKEPEPVESEESPPSQSEETPAPEQPKKASNSGLIVLILVVLAAAGVGYYFTAEDGIAIVGGTSNLKGIKPSITDNPETICNNQDETKAIPGGFTPEAAVRGDDGRLGTLTIPNLGVTAGIFQSGDDMADMAKGIAHFPHSSAWDGNVCLSAHNVNFNGSRGYFYAIHKLEPGAEIIYETALGRRVYEVTFVKEIAEDDWRYLCGRRKTIL